MSKLDFDRAEFQFSQDGNTLGSTESYESITISLETQLPGERPFIVVKSETGWSLDDPKELTNLIDACLNAYKNLPVATGEENEQIETDERRTEKS